MEPKAAAVPRFSSPSPRCILAMPGPIPPLLPGHMMTAHAGAAQPYSIAGTGPEAEEKQMISPLTEFRPAPGGRGAAFVAGGGLEDDAVNVMAGGVT